MEEHLLTAAQNVLIDNESILSLNEKDRGGLFSKLTVNEMCSVLSTLNMQYDHEMLDEIEGVLNDQAAISLLRMRLRAILHLRDHLIMLIEGVRRVVMVTMADVVKLLFSAKVWRSMHDQDAMVLETEGLKFSMILKLFPNAEQVTVN